MSSSASGRRAGAARPVRALGARSRGTSVIVSTEVGSRLAPSGPVVAEAIANIDKFLERTESHLRGLQNFHQDDDRKMNVRTFDTNDTFDTSMMYGTLPMKAGKRVFQTLCFG